MKQPLYKILVIDDEESSLETIRICLENSKLEILTAPSGNEGIRIFEREHPNVVLTDLRMPEMNGLEVLTALKSINSKIPVILLTAYDDVPHTIDAMQHGAYDFVSKPVKVDTLRELINRALLGNRSEDQNTAFEMEYNDYSEKYGLLGKTAVMRELIKKIGLISTNRTTLLIEGENGTGKEILARTIHSYGITKNQPFIGVNCSALTSTLLESELFGHEKGSFTGANRTKKGKLELAGHGTLFLDEVAEMPLDMQVKLLRVLQEKEFERVGGEDSIPFSARIIAATNKNLYHYVDQKKFREDLYHRLNILYLKIPPLRERKEDIPLLAVNLLGRINRELNKNVNKIPFETMELLKAYEWHGNIRELENVLRRAVVLAKSDYIEKEHVIFENHFSKPLIGNVNISLAEMERRHIEFVLNHVNWNKHKACEILDISKPTLLKKIKDYNLQPEKNT